MNKKKMGFWFQMPAMVLLVASALGSLFVKISGSFPLNWMTPITLLIIVVLFFMGRKYEKSNAFDF